MNIASFLSLQDIIISKICKGNIKFSKRNEEGLGFQLVVSCEKDTHILSSLTIKISYEINRRFMFAIRLLGVGSQGVNNFCGIIDIGKGFF